jgi:hypothetical protein
MAGNTYRGSSNFLYNIGSGLREFGEGNRRAVQAQEAMQAEEDRRRALGSVQGVGDLFAPFQAGLEGRDVPLSGDIALNPNGTASSSPAMGNSALPWQVPPAMAAKQAAKAQRATIDQQTFNAKPAFNKGTAELDAIESDYNQGILPPALEAIGREEIRKRQALLPGFTEFPGSESSPGALFYKMEESRANRNYRPNTAFGMPTTPARSGGTVSFAPMGDRALQLEADRLTTEDANSAYVRNLATARAQDPFGTNVYNARQGFVQSRLEAENRLYSESLSKLNYQLQNGLIDRGTYDQSKAAMDQERAIKSEQIQPKGGFEKQLGNSLY